MQLSDALIHKSIEQDVMGVWLDAIALEVDTFIPGSSGLSEEVTSSTPNCTTTETVVEEPELCIPYCLWE